MHVKRKPEKSISYFKGARVLLYGYTLKSVRDGDGPRTSPRCVKVVWKNFQMNNFDMPNNVSSMKYALKSVPGLADVGVPHGDGPRTPPKCLEG